MSYESAITEVLLQVYPGVEITTEAMHEINVLIDQLINRIFQVKNKSNMLQFMDLYNIIGTILPSELAKHGASEGLKIVENPNRLVFPIGVIKNKIKIPLDERPVIFIAAVLEYLTAEILEAACRKAHDDGEDEITISHLRTAFSEDEELMQLFKTSMIPTSTQVMTSEPTVMPAPTQIPVHTKVSVPSVVTVQECIAVKKDGKKCTYKAKSGQYCGIHKHKH